MPRSCKNCIWVMPPAGACGVISRRKAIPSICCGASASLTHRATTPSTGAWFFPAARTAASSTLYGRSIGTGFAHRFLPGSKGDLFAWEAVRQFPSVILVEGMFDLAVLWQAGFRHATCSLGTHLTPDQFRQLCDRPRTVYLTFDVDANGSGQQAAQALAPRLRAQGITTRRVLLPSGHDPNSFFVQGGDARQFHSLLEEARS
jgi:hypothetical protein